MWQRAWSRSVRRLVSIFVGLIVLRHLYALYCLYQKELRERRANGSITPDDPCSKSSLPKMFTDPGWNVLGTSILSTSNCGNPALRMFGFGPVAAAGYGIGYIIRDNGISV